MMPPPLHVCNGLARPAADESMMARNTWITDVFGWLRGTVVERRCLTGELSLFCARPAPDG